MVEVKAKTVGKMAKVFNIKKYKKVRQALRRNMPKAEWNLWMRLKNKQIFGYKFRRQYGIDSYVVDFYCPKVKLAVEVDGDSHFKYGVKEKDKRRQNKIESYGIKVLRFTNIDIYENIESVLDQIWGTIKKLAGENE